MASYVPYALDHDEAFVEVIDFHTDKPKIFRKKDSMGSEKQISVDPISLREPSKQQQMGMDPPTTSPRMDVVIPLAPRRRTKLVSQSLPNSATSSPRFAPKVPKKRREKRSHSVSSALHRQDSIALANLERLREVHLQRSKSCGEGRASAPAEDFDLWVIRDKAVKVQNKPNRDEYTYHDINKYTKIDKKVDDTVYTYHDFNKNNTIDKKIHAIGTTAEDGKDTCEEKFKCKALCLYLPAFSKVKSVRARRQSSDVSQAKESETGHVVSKRVSLEKFECASMDSSSLIDDDDEETSNLFFDLPLELIKCSINDTHSPVTTGFVFDNEPKMKGVLKNSISKASDSSVRHVRFSTSSSTSCVTPSMHDTQDDFSAFIEAQSV